ncbi:zinc finger protein GLI2-like [Penaeus chinensis]|uniref:zinc finger protein GLI2-like n=1 Tax=Penaeus chinensis TaxID=139456 RepID=UPI001FB84DB4|nr:zinc finger protein GLI2-like [Penaeus chinensis]
MQEKKSVPLGLGSAFAALPPPPPLPVDQRTHEGRYVWDPARLHTLHAPHHGYVYSDGSFVSTSHLLGVSGGNPALDLPLVGGRLGAAPLGTTPGDLPAPPHPPYRIPPYMEHLYQSLHTSPQASLRGLSPLESRVSPCCVLRHYDSAAESVTTQDSHPSETPENKV